MEQIPRFFEEKLEKQYNEKIKDTIISNLQYQLPVTLRINNIKSNKEEVINELKTQNIEFKNVLWYNEALIIENADEEKIKKLRIYEEGKIYMQSLSSMLPPIILEPKENENILDMCSAPGGKTTEIASISNNKAFITAVEQNRIRAERLKYNVQKQGCNTINVMVEDSRNLSDFFKFDKILLDAPCSGSGTKNVFKQNFTEELIKKSSKSQETLIKKALNLLKPNGILIYSTCSILKEENETILEKVLKNNNCKLEQIVLNEEIPKLPSSFKEVCTICPNNLYEGFFVAKIRKTI